MDELLATLDPEERHAVGLLKLALDAHNRGEGTGLLAGKSRYVALQERARLAAYASATIRAFWSRLCRAMLWPPTPAADDAAILAVIGPQAAGYEARVLRQLTDNTAAVLLVAREWHRTEREAARAEGRAESGGDVD